MESERVEKKKGKKVYRKQQSHQYVFSLLGDNFFL